MELFILKKEMFIMELDLKCEKLAHEVDRHGGGDPDFFLKQPAEIQNKLLELARRLMKRNNEISERNLELLEENYKLKEAMAELEEEEELEGEELGAYYNCCDAIENAMGGRHVTTWVPH